MKKVLFLTGLVVWAVLGMACGKKAEDTSAKYPDPDRDGICSPWVSQNGALDEYGHLCMGVDKCPDQAGSGNADGCP